MARNKEIADLKATSSKALMHQFQQFEIKRQKLVKERQNYGMQEVTSNKRDIPRSATQDLHKEGGITTTGFKSRQVPKITSCQSKLKEGAVATQGVKSKDVQVELAAIGKTVGKNVGNQRELAANQSKCKEVQLSPKKMKKAEPKKLDFSHLQCTFATINRKVNTMPPTSGEEQIIPTPQQPECPKSKGIRDATAAVSNNPVPQSEPSAAAMNNSAPIERDATSELLKKLHAIPKGSKILQATSVTQKRTEESQEESPLSGSESPLSGSESPFPSPENTVNQEESKNGRCIVKATTIDQFLKENGIDVERDGESVEELNHELNFDGDDSSALNENYHPHVMADIDCAEGQAGKKRGRGNTTCADIYGRTREQREEVTFEKGQPVGPTNQAVSNLSSFVGTIGRNKRFVSLLYTNWHAIHPKSKEFMWKYVNTKFILPASAQKWVMHSIRDAWKRFKGKIKLKHFKPYDNFDDMVKNRPFQVPEDQFIKLLLYWSHPAIQAVSQKNKKHREQQKFPHRMGPVNFARVRAALRESRGDNEEPKRFEIFIATRTSRKRKELDAETQSAIEEYQIRQASGETDEEAFKSLFGKE